MNPGQRLGPYEVLQQLGAGGMGEVWLATDTRLGRKVAIKVLPAAVGGDPERLARFRQEARASAALNHPHIAVIHDVGTEVDASGAAVHYMVQEYLQGETLRQRLDRGALELREAVLLGRQVAGALAAAHEAGIVHRDLKPDNLFLIAPDHVKVLDFGLAKLSEVAPVAPVDASMSPTRIGTTVGQLLGTAGYMAPEQVRGEEVDHRADLFAFGCVLHEMLTGRRAFSGRTVHQTLDIILNDEPEMPEEPRRFVPAQLDWIRRKCLAKEASRRYQHADELAVDLARFGDDLGAGKVDLAPARPQAPAAEGRKGAAAALLSPPGLAAMAATAALGAVVAAWLLAPAPLPPAPVQLTDFSTWAGSPAISPNGDLLAFVAQEPQSADSQVWIKTLPDGEALQLTDTPGAKDMPVFSPDGSRVAYTVMGDEWQWDTWIVPIVGGTPRLMLRNANSLTWAPDGRVLYSEFRRGAQLAIVSSEESGADKRDVWVPELNQMAHSSHVSPDGSRVVIGYMGEGPLAPGRAACFVRDLHDVEADVRLVGGGEVPCRWFARWSPDGQWIYFHSFDAIWREPAAGGSPERIFDGEEVVDSGGWTPFAVHPAGDALTVGMGTETRDVWLQDPEGRLQQVTYAGDAVSPTFTADGRSLLYVARYGWDGGPVWILDRDTGLRQQPCPGSRAVIAAVSPRGDRVVLQSAGAGENPRTGRTELRLCTVDGSEPVRRLLESESDQFNAVFSPDGRVVYFRTGDDTERTAPSIWRVNVDGTDARPLAGTTAGLEINSVSPDGGWLSVTDLSDSPRQTWLYPVSGDGERRLAVRAWQLYWSPGGGTWVFNNGGMVATSWVLENPDGVLLPPDMPEQPTGAWFESAGARRVLVGGNFSLPALSPTPYEIAFERQQPRSNLYRMAVPR